jgi:hypothetical protein
VAPRRARRDDPDERTLAAEQPLLTDGEATPWWQARSASRRRSGAGRTGWPLLGLWLDGGFHFVTAESSRKGRKPAADPRCTVAASSTTLPALDLVIEGEAVKVTDQAKLRRVTEAYGSSM